ncbi:hypothetical protein [Streptomyces sp. NPDC001661]
MIRAGRRDFVQNSADLAAAMGVASKTFRNQKPYEAENFPDPISPPEAKGKLWDDEQTAAYLTGAPVPELPDTDDDEDLLERTEAAAFLNVSPKTWDSYKKDPGSRRTWRRWAGSSTARAASCAPTGRSRPPRSLPRTGPRGAATWCPVTSCTCGR